MDYVLMWWWFLERRGAGSLWRWLSFVHVMADLFTAVVLMYHVCIPRKAWDGAYTGWALRLVSIHHSS